MEFTVTGTLIWYYYICQREVWLMARHLVPDQDNPNVDLGRFIHQGSYQRNKKEIDLGNARLDLIRTEHGDLVVGEVKKSSRFLPSARMQLLFYLWQLKEMGLEARGELLFPAEKKKEDVILDAQAVEELQDAVAAIERIACGEQAPPPAKNKYCRNCAYQEFCWS